MKVKCRCHKCRTRRTLNKHPDKYVNVPKCPVAGCGGEMRVDQYRQSRGSKDRAAKCKVYGCRHSHRLHRVDSVDCVGHADYVLSKQNSKPETSEEAPF